MKVFLDDERLTPDGWVRAYTQQEAIAFLKTGNVTEISLDHDLGIELNSGTGYGVLLWIEEEVHTHHWVPPKILIHSANPPARDRMQRCVEAIYNFIAAAKVIKEV